MTVAELIEELKKLPPECDVYIDYYDDQADIMLVESIKLDDGQVFLS